MTEGGTVVAVAQIALTVGDLDANREAARAAVAEAAIAGARLVVLPELSDSGYLLSDAGEARSLASPAASGRTLREWRSLAATHDLTIAGGFCELGLDGKLYNSAAIVDAAGTRAVYRKAHLWDAEKEIFTPGDDAPPVVELPFGNVGLMICYDLEFPEWVRLAALRGADLIAVPVNWAASGPPAPPGERSGEVVAAQAAASSNGVFIAVADRCGTERGVDWLGGSVIVRRGGYPAAGAVCENRAAVLTATIDLRQARDKRISELNDLFTDRRPDLYARLWNVAQPAGNGRSWPAGPAAQRDLVRRGYDAISVAYRSDDGLAASPSAEDVSRYAGWVQELASLLPDRAIVADLGCGAGLPATRELTDCGLRVLGADFSAVQLSRARRLVPAASFVQADMTALHLQPGSLDAVVSFYALIHVPLGEQRALFPRIRSWLRDGGYLLAITGADRWTGVETYLGAEMFWDHADTATYLQWLTAARLQPVWHRYVPEGDGGHSLILARAE